MAPEIPLVLQSCEFEGLKSICSSDSKQALNEHLERECRSYKLQAAIFHEAIIRTSVEIDDNISIERTKKKEASYTPLLFQPTERTNNFSWRVLAKSVLLMFGLAIRCFCFRTNYAMNATITTDLFDLFMFHI